MPDAIGRLLGGTGLTFSSRDGAFYIQKAATASITLGPVRVGGTVAHESATGPGVGYVATNTLTGSKTDTPIIEIPNSIHVITKQQMIDQQPQNVMEALRYTPACMWRGWAASPMASAVVTITAVSCSVALPPRSLSMASGHIPTARGDRVP